MRLTPRSIPLFFFTASLAAALVAGCSDETSGSTTASTSTGSGGAGGAGGMGGADPYVRHDINPKETDSAIDQAFDDHFAAFDPKLASNGKLFVHLPGLNGTPAESLQILELAVAAGYHVVGLMYVNTHDISTLCAADLDCYEGVRLEIINGMDTTDKITVSVANSIENRLSKLLAHLNSTYPDEGWGAFQDGGGPLYASISLSGYSQGGGHAALIAKTRALARVVLFSAVTDGDSGISASWLKKNPATANSLHFGIAHTQDPAFDQITSGWATLGLSFFGIPVDVDTIDPPYANSHQLTTSLNTVTGNSHAGTALDAHAPIVEGKSALVPAWTYLIGK
ncbi:MAG: hypothetical protein HUU21_30350 [Polyangiaceae bacterium]|nr:hypothetical protein [Polyangiaceae bacterium]